ncbi:hypothetical protein BOO35_19335 [Vibrio navarrensis]|uniref:glycosyltransferase family 2 protein n=1 Tax=Vibrio navarrensis TaxID=29495 RepID=UPI0018688A21|nr:hypothetical protein [Vibrio navarrensis]MBE3667212.1 hypothetical protein [Vibrio navarrensis]
MSKQRTVSILVVLYNKEISDSSTINNLVSSNEDLSRTKLIIWNNGPNKVIDTTSSLENKFNEVFLVETLENLPLSGIYNAFMKNYISDYYMFLDDDSSVTDSYLSVINDQSDAGLFVPVLVMNGNVVSPKPDNKGGLDYIPEKIDGLVAMGSGLILSRELSDCIIKKYGDCFDNRFYFYGVDTSLFYRIKRLHLENEVSIVQGFEHSVSTFKKENTKVKKFRQLEASYSLGLKLRYYPSIKIFATFFRMSFLRFFRLSNRVTFFYVLKAYASGKHYRM